MPAEFQKILSNSSEAVSQAKLQENNIAGEYIIGNFSCNQLLQYKTHTMLGSLVTYKISKFGIEKGVR